MFVYWCVSGDPNFVGAGERRGLTAALAILTTAGDRQRSNETLQSDLQ
jgi:hypothetical protein